MVIYDVNLESMEARLFEISIFFSIVNNMRDVI